MVLITTWRLITTRKLIVTRKFRAKLIIYVSLQFMLGLLVMHRSTDIQNIMTKE